LSHAARPQQAETSRKHSKELVVRPTSEVKTTTPSSPPAASPEAELQASKGMSSIVGQFLAQSPLFVLIVC